MKRFKYLAKIASLMLLILSCNSSANQDNQSKPDLEEEEIAEQANAQLTSHVFLKLVLNDTCPGFFLFDSGANGLVVDTRFARDHDLPVSTDASGHTHGVGEGKTPHRTIDQLDVFFDGRNFSPEEIRVMPLDSLFGDGFHRTIHGIVGYDLFRQYCLKFDFEKVEVTLLDTLLSDDLGEYSKVKYRKEYRKPMVPVEISVLGLPAFKCKLIFDMGSGRSISLTQQKSRDEGLFQTLSEWDCSGGSASGMGGDSYTCYGMLDSLIIAEEIHLGQLELELGRDTGGALGLHTMYDGMIGMDVIRHFDLIIDQEEEVLYLKKNDARL